MTACGVSKYTGPGSCAASSCHGSVQPRMVTRIFQNEYSIWIAQDKHARAFSVLSNPVSVRMGKILNMGPPSQAQRCLACHALSVGADERTQSFDLNDGVSCESCHGPASEWLGRHTDPTNWPYEKLIERCGMYPTRDLIKRSEKCLSCHLGTADKFVDHEMIAAGHPDLTFELSYFTFYMPPHWKTPEQGDIWKSVKGWGVGQAVQLRESLYELERQANGPIWPEYAELDCFACHHSLTAAMDSWRQERGYPGRRPGNPPWNQARVVVFRDLVKELHPDTAQRLDDELMGLADLMNQLNGNRQKIAASAKHAAVIAGELAIQLDSQAYDSGLTLRLMRRIAIDSKAIANQDERAAQQAAMTLDDLYMAYQQNTKPPLNADVGTAIDALIQQLQQNPSAYSAPKFAAGMQRVSQTLGQ
ncbi:MAG: multiheme c-type cytochrome [Candidatus Korobacteraceae bacterium]